MRVLLVQFAGDYREAWQRLRAGGSENYRGQRVHVQIVEDLAKEFEAVGQLAYFTETSFDEVLPNKVRAIGLGLRTTNDDAVISKIEEFGPTHLVLRLLSTNLLKWAVQHPNLRTLVLCAESRRNRHLLHWWRNWKLANLLNRKPIEWVCNHQRSATQWMKKIGVDAEKLIPWDMEYDNTPDALPEKTLRTGDGPWKLVFVGSLIDGKGVPEILEAVRHLRADNFHVHAWLAGRGEETRYQAMAAQMGIADRIEFAGLVPNEQAFLKMREADLVIVPSRHKYTEAFPLTLLEGMLSRTPVVVSDHPMFRERIVDGESGLMFSAGDASKLAFAIRKVLTDAALYQRLSIGGAKAWHAMQIPCRWGDVLQHWLHDGPEDRDWLWRHRLASGIYSS